MEDFGYSKNKNHDENLGIAKRVFLIAASLFSVACFIYVTINAYNFIYSDNKNVETIESPSEPIKVVENNENNQDLTIDRSVYEDIFGNNKESLKDAKPTLRKVVQPAIPPVLKKLTKENLNDDEDEKIDIKDNSLEKTAVKTEKSVKTAEERRKNAFLQKKEKVIVKPKKRAIKVQIAAMTSRKSAEDYWEKLNRIDRRIFSRLDPFIEEVDLGKRGIFYRLQIGIFFNQVDADKFCSKYVTKMRKTRADCIVVE